MHDSTRNRRRRPSALVLFIVVAITTGWAQSAPRTSQPLAPTITPTAFRQVDDAVAQNPVVDPAPIVPVAHAQHPQRTFAAIRPAPVAKAPVAKAPVANAPIVAKAHTISGRNHFWMPALGISRPVYLFPCTRTSPPSNLVYRWGCAGRNNVYLLGHAWGVMKPLHDAYVSGRLRVGMIAMYADGNGRIRTYRVTEWRVVDPVDSRWAIADQPVPSMTLQTCVGPNGQYRLNVRLVAVN